MTIALFDVQTGFGGVAGGEREPLAADEYLQVMNDLDLARALIRAIPDTLHVDVCARNAELFGACRDRAELVPCPVIVPATAYDLPPEPEQVAAFVANGAGAALIRPKHDDWQLLPWVADRLFRAMSERRLPLYCLAQHVSLREVAEIAGRHPGLPVILAQVAYRAQRTIIPLLEQFANVRLSIGSNWTIHRGIEVLVEHVGPRQLLFGTGFPEAEPMMAVTQLMYADIPDEHKARIGSGNMEQLLAEIRA